MTIIYLKWRDAINSNSSYPIGGMGGLAELHEVGFLLKETDDTITLGSESPDEKLDARFWLTIPKNAIIEQRRSTLARAFPAPRRKRVPLVPVLGTEAPSPVPA
jgi:hypothetical protein